MVLPDKGLLSGQWTEEMSKQRQDFEQQQLELMGGAVIRRFTTEDEDPRLRKNKEEKEADKFLTWLVRQSAAFQEAYRIYEREQEALDQQNARTDNKLAKILEKLEQERGEWHKKATDLYSKRTVILANGEHVIETENGAVCIDENLQITHKLDEKERAEYEEKKKHQPNLVTDDERQAMRERLERIEQKTEHAQALREENKAAQERTNENRRKVENGEVTDPKQLQAQTKERTEEQNRIESNADSLGEDDPGTKQTTSYSKTMEQGTNAAKLGNQFNGAVVQAPVEKPFQPPSVAQTPPLHL